MTLQSLLKRIMKLDYPQELDKSYDGSCPCFWYEVRINDKYLKIHGHCWRTCENMHKKKDYCAYNGLHVESNLDKKELDSIIQTLKKKLDKEEWYSDYEVWLNGKRYATISNNA
jgi:hypothetical protein